MELEDILRTFVHILRMTRSARNFPEWDLESVLKAFQWSDFIHNISSTTGASIQLSLSNIRAIVGSTGIIFIDSDPECVFFFSRQTLLKCILSSPIISWCPHNILQHIACLNQIVLFLF